MKTERMASREAVQVTAEPFDFLTAEPLLLVHLLQKLAYVKKGIAMAFTDVETQMLGLLLTRRLEELGRKREDA